MSWRCRCCRVSLCCFSPHMSCCSHCRFHGQVSCQSQRVSGRVVFKVHGHQWSHRRCLEVCTCSPANLRLLPRGCPPHVRVDECVFVCQRLQFDGSRAFSPINLHTKRYSPHRPCIVTSCFFELGHCVRSTDLRPPTSSLSRCTGKRG